MFRFLVALRWLAMGLIAAAITFACAGRINLPGVWGVLGTLVAFGLVMSATADIGLLRERVSPAAKSRDRVTQPVSLVMMLSQWVIAGLDARYGWSPIPLPVVIAGVAGYASALAFVLWAMYANPFYSSVVRVQTDRGQTPIARGPYAIVRHPGYAGSMLAFVAGGLAFGSWLAMVSTAVALVLFLRRTLLEDRLLVAELPGYADYARRVRYRLVPGVI